MRGASGDAPLLPGRGRVLAVGIGGGGDVAGALAVADLAAAFGRETVLGGLTWERRPIDPAPGPRRLEEITGAERLHEAVALAGPQTRGPDGLVFAEVHMAAHLGEETVLVDPHPAPPVIGAGIAEAARRLACDLAVLLDVGGDVLAHGDEPGLASPLADAMLLASAPAIRAAGISVVGAVFGAGCDGELTPTEVLDRVAEVAHAGGMLGTWGLSPTGADRMAAAIDRIPTEASAMALRCARGSVGDATIRDGRRTVRLSPVGALTFVFSPETAMASAARVADAVGDAPSLAAANAMLHRMGIRTELDYETDAAGGRPPAP